MEIYVPSVKDISLYKEIARNIVNPLELPREAISNAIDAEAKIIMIDVFRNETGKFCISISDDGYGMDTTDIGTFFNLGDSKKDIRSIGEKGLGTKIFFKSESITVISQKDNLKRIIAKMEKPWEKLILGDIPSYTLEEFDNVVGKNGTTVIIEGYLINNPEKYFNFETLKDYILWFTACGSFKSIFATFPELNTYVKNMQIAPRVFINDRILGIKKEIAGGHQFHLPQENPIEDSEEKIYKKSVNYCRHFGPYHKSTNIEGEYVSFQMYGTISGINCRKKICKLRQSETIKGRFGIYLAKDFIPIIKRTGLMTDPNYHHFHILVNSQNFELTADRNNISNEDDAKVKWILASVKKIIEADIMPSAYKTYFKMRRQEECLKQIAEKNYNLNKRIERLESISDLKLEGIPIKKVPDNEGQVALLLIALLSSEYKKYIRYIDNIGQYSHQSTTDLICYDKNEKLLLVEIELKLSNIFRHEHPYETFDCIVCWDIDIEVNEKRRLIDGIELKLINEKQQWMLKYGTNKVIPIIELSSIIVEINTTNLF